MIPTTDPKFKSKSKSNLNTIKEPTRRCDYCKDRPGIIFKSDLPNTIRMSDGTLKCYTCQMDDYPQARQIVEEDRRSVNNFNSNADMLYKSGLIKTPLKKKQYRYRYSILNSIENNRTVG
jgi:hypothetical protein